MARRIGKGFVGKSILGDLVVDGSTIRTIKAGANLLFDATGNIEAVDNLQINSQGTLRLYDSDDSNYVALRSASTVASNLTYTLPNSVTNGYFLQTDSSGNLTFAQPAISVSNNTVSASTYYLTLTTSTSGNINSVTTTNSKLSFQPSTGKLTVTAFVSNSVDIGGGNIDGTAIGVSTASSAAFTTLTTTGNVDLGNAASDTLTVNASIDSNLIPSGTTRDLGSTTARWRNIYTNDLHLSNGIGDYTVVEGEEDLFLYNNKSGKVFKFALIEVDASEAPAKAKEDKQ